MWSLPAYDNHEEGHRGATLPQLTLLLLWLASLVLWLTQHLPTLGRTPPPPDPEAAEQGEEEEGVKGVSQNGPVGNVREANSSSVGKAKTFSEIPDAPSFSQCLTYLAALGTILLYFYLCDYVKIFPKEERVYTRDTFLFLVFLLFLVAMATSVRDTSNKILSRDQTEEWKGWMQVMFVWYHYFNAKEWYNWIRIYIACYVWMTGFGNFSFFWVKKDFSLWRFMKMFFRLNFLVVLVCASVSNEYMLYYICAMHTYWFLSVYATMAILPSWNQDRYKMAAKLAVYAICNFLLFDVPEVASVVFRPLWFILGLNDGHDDVMHEWVFRIGLDHWVCFVGMLCAYNYPYFESFILHLESQKQDLHFCKLRVNCGNAVKAGVGVVVLGVYMVWHLYLLPLEKFTYNHQHPYTSFIPILTYIYFRNISVYLRGKYMHVFAWLGKVTLETYLSQLHIYLQSNAKHLIGYFHGYPLLNFAFATMVYLPISHALFQITVGFSAYLLPKDANERGRKLIITFFSIAVAAIMGQFLKLL